MLDFLPERLGAAVRHINRERLYELRVRADKPLLANLGGEYVYLGERGREERADGALRPTRKEIDDILFAASGFSMYSVAEQVKRGFLTGACGERIGIAGSYVYDGSGVLSVHSVTSLCIRVPHAVRGCAEHIYDKCLGSGLCSLILLSPPGEGKTTLLRDLTRLVCERMRINVLVSDERGELSAGDLGDSADVIRFADKLTAFTAGIRAMRPTLIVTDELLPEDYAAVKRAVAGGICVFASAHLVNANDVPDGLFERRILLSGLGRVGHIFDGAGNAVD